MKVCHVTTVHPPGDGRIFRKECVSLAEAGFDVVLVGAGEGDGVREGVRVVGVPRRGSRSARVALSGIDALRAARRQRADLYHVHDPELVPFFLGLRLLGERVVFDMHEDLPKQVTQKHWIPPVLRGLVRAGARALEALTIASMSGVVVVVPPMLEKVGRRPHAIVRNFPRPEEFAGTDGEDTGGGDPTIVYTGAITRPRGARQMVEAMALLEGSTSARLVMVGRFQPPDLEQELSELPGWRSVDYPGWVDREGIRRLLASAEAGLVLYLDEGGHTDAYPTKLFEYMMAGVPIVASDFPEWRRIVGSAECGLLVDPEDPAAIAAAVARLLADGELRRRMSRLGREAALRDYNWDNEARTLVEFYESLGVVAKGS